MSQIWNTTGQEVSQQVLSFTSAEDVVLDEKVFLPYDIKASKVHAEMLNQIGVLDELELKKIEQGLEELLEIWQKGEFKIKSGEEDCHTAMEAYLTENFGEVGEKIHTGRSRNDQSLTMVRLYILDQLLVVKKLMDDLNKVWSTWILENGECVMPGYTHMQKAMPTTVGVWQESFMVALKDVGCLLDGGCEVLNQSPLGSGAGYDVPLELDKEFTAKKLGFNKVQKNPIYCHLSRAIFEPQALHICNMVMTVLSRWANDLLLFTTSEFGFFSLPQEFCTGSSIMPQKQNYDVLELLRGKQSVVYAAKTEVDLVVQRLYSGYQRDLQLLKGPLVRAFETLITCLEMALVVAKNLKVEVKNLEASMAEEIYATEKVYEYVKVGIPFRQAYSLVKEDILRRSPLNKKLRRS